ncbi:MAG: hypothetical protein ACLUOL_04475 [Faecalibacterium sp.]
MDVPNATVMVIENAERYGLSALHQLRGRVGRGAAESWCFLVSDNAPSRCRSGSSFSAPPQTASPWRSTTSRPAAPATSSGAASTVCRPWQIADLMNDTRTLHAAQSEAGPSGRRPASRAARTRPAGRQVEQMFDKAGAMN